MILTRPKTEKELQACWYSKHEIKRFRTDVHLAAGRFAKSRASKVIKQIAYSILRGTPQSEVNFHHEEVVLGIEHLISPSVMKILMKKRTMTITRVLDEQEYQTRTGEKSRARLALASMENSAFTKEWRRRLAYLHMSD